MPRPFIKTVINTDLAQARASREWQANKAQAKKDRRARMQAQTEQAIADGKLKRLANAPMRESAWLDKKRVKASTKALLEQANLKIAELEREALKFRSNQKKTFYDSDAWRAIRYGALKRSNRQCDLCKASNVELHVDHIKPRSKYPALELDPNNLQVLCRDCNLGKSNRDDTDWRRPALKVVSGN